MFTHGRGTRVHPGPRAWWLHAPRLTAVWRGGSVVVALGFGIGVYLAATLGALWWQGTRDERRPVEAILVLGAAQWNGLPSPVLQARLDHAIELYQSGYAPRLIVTGGVGDGDEYSEAAVSATYLLAHGIPAEAILAEERGRSSLESLRGAASVLGNVGLSRVLLVSDPPHMLRILRIARSLGLEAYGSPASDSPIAASLGAQAHYLLRELVLYQGYQIGIRGKTRGAGA